MLSLNIKNEKAYRLTKKLADITGENLTATVINSVQERLDRIEQRNNDDRLERILAIGRDCASRLNEPWLSMNHGDLLYDEMGLPK